MRLRRFGIGCLGVAAGAAAACAWLLTAAFAMNLQPWAIALAVVATGCSWVTWRIHRALAPKGPKPPTWDAAIREAVSALPKGTRVRRSTAGGRSPLAWAAFVIYGLGLFFAVGWAIGSQTGEGGGIVAWVVVGCGATAGVLLSVARDRRMRRVEIGTVLGLPAVVALLVLFPAAGAEGRAPDPRQLLVGVLGVVLFAGVPVLGGFAIPRAVAWLYRSSRPANAWQGAAATPTTLLPELEAATNHRRAAAVLRVYPASRNPDRLLREDGQALEAAGYRLVATAVRPEAEIPGDLPVFWLPRGAQAATVALFVKGGPAAT